MNINEKSISNLNQLKDNPYPGRGIITGMSPDSKNMVQVYWIMGRSENSRNRVFVNENGFIKTEPWDIKKVEDPSLIIYYVARNYNDTHIVTNGDQTDTIYNALMKSGTFESALDTRVFEPDAPNYTPRISGIIDLSDKQYSYKLSILKSMDNNPDFCQRQFYCYEKAIPGFGHCIHTYKEDGNPLPSFAGEPYTLPLFDDINETAQFYWNALNEENKISVLVKFIDVASNEFKSVIINKHK
ncbi:MAG TPA: IMP cyclohydrolase [Clostridia bacterium]